MKPLEVIAYYTIHKSNLSVEELAAQIGVSASLLYKMANPQDDSADFKLRHLVPLMLATSNFSILHTLANLCGFVCVKIPRGRKWNPKRIAVMGRAFQDCICAVSDYCDDEINSDEALVQINGAMVEAAAAKKMVESWTPQQDLFAGE